MQDLIKIRSWSNLIKNLQMGNFISIIQTVCGGQLFIFALFILCNLTAESVKTNDFLRKKKLNNLTLTNGENYVIWFIK